MKKKTNEQTFDLSLLMKRSNSNSTISNQSTTNLFIVKTNKISKTVISKNKNKDNIIRPIANNNLKKIIEEENKKIRTISNLSIKNTEIKDEILEMLTKKNLEMIDLEYYTKEYKESLNLLDTFPERYRDSRITVNANIEYVNQQLNKANELISNLQLKNSNLEIFTKLREEDIKNQEEAIDSFLKKLEELENQSRTIEYDLMKIEEDNKIAERNEKLSIMELVKMEEKKIECYKKSKELICNTILLKPFYKKYIILRKNELSNFLKISKNRKNIVVRNTDSSEITIKFDYIISSYENLYEMNNIYEKDYINDELLNLMNNYITKVIDINEGKNIVMLYLTNSINNKNISNDNLIHSLNLLFHKLSYYGFQISVKIVMSKKVKEFINGLSNLDNFSLSQLEYDDEIVGLLFKITNSINKTDINILNISYNDHTRLFPIATKFNEINMTKKKRLASSKKKKYGKDVTFILDEINFEDMYYFATFLDINEQESSLENIKEVLFTIS